MAQAPGVTVFIIYRDERGEPLLELDLSYEITLRDIHFAEDVTKELILEIVDRETAERRWEYPAVMNIEWLAIDSVAEE